MFKTIENLMTTRDQKVISIAPMMDWTDRHCRYFHRQLTRHALLYTEMVVADAVIHGDRQRLLGFGAEEHPLALQLGGSEPGKLATAVRIAADFGYDEVNLNVGCPSDRVQSGTFGACLMKTPGLVGTCVAAMREAAPSSMRVTIKCRLGVDDQDSGPALDALADIVHGEGCERLWVHARKAWLQGLSPKENRDVPPLDYDRVYRLKAHYPDWFIGLNGGITTMDEVKNHLDICDGVMLGRAAYHNPSLLAAIDPMIKSGFQTLSTGPDYPALIEGMAHYADRHIAAGGRLHHVTRHMIGLFQGQPGARRYRQILSHDAAAPGATSLVLRDAFDAVDLGERVAA